jgi:hypothetical protein
VLRQVLPSLPLDQIGALAAAPQTAASFCVAPLVAGWADASSKPRRRFLTAWFGGASSCAALAASAACMLTLGTRAGPAASVPVIGLLMLAHVALTCCSGAPLLALINRSTPPELLPYSWAVINSIGNIGGFVGPSLLGGLHDALPGPPCSSPSHLLSPTPGCLAPWGGGCAVMAALCSVFTVGSGCAVWSRMRGGTCGGGAAAGATASHETSWVAESS